MLWRRIVKFFTHGQIQATWTSWRIIGIPSKWVAWFLLSFLCGEIPSPSQIGTDSLFEDRRFLKLESKLEALLIFCLFRSWTDSIHLKEHWTQSKWVIWFSCLLSVENSCSIILQTFYQDCHALSYKMTRWNLFLCVVHILQIIKFSVASISAGNFLAYDMW